MNASQSDAARQDHSDPHTPWWRSIGFWGQALVQLVLVLMFYPQPAENNLVAGQTRPIAELVGETPLEVLMAAGTLLVFVGLLLQRSRRMLGLWIVIAGLIVMALSAGAIFILGYWVVVYEAFFISRHIATRRVQWLIALIVGSLVTVVYIFAVNGVFTRYYQDFSGPAWRWHFSTQALIGEGMLTFFIVASIVLMWLFGANRRRHFSEIENLKARAELAALTERNRIAREMHDVVAHSLTVVIAQADGGRFAGKTNPDAALKSLETISSVGREALQQMRGLLSVLHDDGNERQVTRAPGVEAIGKLIEEARSAGLRVGGEEIGTRRDLDESRGLTVFRMVQEGLTNALKHAGRTEATVTLDWGETRENWLIVTVENMAGEALVNQDGAGRGLRGIEQRARIHGGVASWGISGAEETARWQVRLEIPLS